MIQKIKRCVSDVLEMVFPAVCEVCGRALIDGEQLMCMHCRHDMPRTRVHLQPSNEIHHRLAAVGIPINKAAAYFYYVRDNPYAMLIQRAKYNSRPSIDFALGADFARELALDDFFDGIDVVQPVPMHWLKKLRRGYNQAEIICRGISSVTGIPVADNLKAASHSTQTRKNAFQRLINVSGIISPCRIDEIAGRHVLLVDDVITTGATLLSAARALLSADPAITLSVLSLAITKKS